MFGWVPDIAVNIGDEFTDLNHHPVKVINVIGQNMVEFVYIGYEDRGSFNSTLNHVAKTWTRRIHDEWRSQREWAAENGWVWKDA